MNAKLFSPLTLAVLALLVGLGSGPVWFWLRAGDLVDEAMLTRRLAALQKAQQQRAQGWNFWTIEIDSLTSELKDEKMRLRKQADQLDQRAARLESERQELEKLRTDIDSMSRAMDERVIAITADEARNLRSLSNTYASLSAPAAVAIIREMDDTTAVKILSLMKPDQVGPIFEAMATTDGGDTSLAHRAAVLSDKLRLMKSGVQAAPGTASAN